MTVFTTTPFMHILCPREDSFHWTFLDEASNHRTDLDVFGIPRALGLFCRTGALQVKPLRKSHRQTPASRSMGCRGVHGHRCAHTGCASLIKEFLWGTVGWRPGKGPLGVSLKWLVEKTEVEPGALIPAPIWDLTLVVTVVRRARAFEGVRWCRCSTSFLGPSPRNCVIAEVSYWKPWEFIEGEGSQRHFHWTCYLWPGTVCLCRNVRHSYWLVLEHFCDVLPKVWSAEESWVTHRASNAPLFKYQVCEIPVNGTLENHWRFCAELWHIEQGSKVHLSQERAKFNIWLQFIFTAISPDSVFKVGKIAS